MPSAAQSNQTPACPVQQKCVTPALLPPYQSESIPHRQHKETSAETVVILSEALSFSQVWQKVIRAVV